MQRSNLKLETYFVERLSWSLAEGFDPGGEFESELECENIHCDIERAELDTPRRAAYRMALEHAARPASAPYEWRLALIGYFELGAGIPDEGAVSFMDSNAPAVLYGAAREVLASALSRGPYAAPLLPTVHFTGLQFQPAPEPALEVAPEAEAKPKRRRKKAEAEASE